MCRQATCTTQFKNRRAHEVQWTSALHGPKRRGDRKMADKMLVTQALDERDLLVKKIQDKIEKASNR